MRSGQTLLVANAILWDFLYEFQKKRDFSKKRLQKNRKTMKDFFLKKKTKTPQMTEIQKKILEGLNKLFFWQKKKRVNFSCSKEHDGKNK